MSSTDTHLDYKKFCDPTIGGPLGTWVGAFVTDTSTVGYFPTNVSQDSFKCPTSYLCDNFLARVMHRVSLPKYVAFSG